MRLVIAAALAALSIAAPAAAQPDPARILRDALEHAAHNVPEGVDDYTMSVSSRGYAMDVHVYRENGQFFTAGETEQGVGGLLTAMLPWPRLAMAYEAGMGATHPAVRDAEYVRADTVDGRPVHVLFAPGLDVDWELMDDPDSILVFVDTETRQVLRLAAAGTEDPQGEGPVMNGGRVHLAFTFGGYQETDGATVPRRVRMELRLQTRLSDEDAKELRVDTQAAMERMREEDPEHAELQAQFIREVARIASGEPMIVEVTIGNVRVNTGPPDWLP